MCKCKDKPYDAAVARMVGNILAAAESDYGVPFLNLPDKDRQFLESRAIETAKRVVKALSNDN